MATLSQAEALQLMKDLPGWALEERAIRKQFVCRGFPEAVSFVSSLVPGAEAADHHPDILINYRRVTLTYTTHSEGGLTQKDFDGARMAEHAFAAGGFAAAKG
jgi:4a-hydroxytetrahydrobiopterin dehydratase